MEMAMAAAAATSAAPTAHAKAPLINAAAAQLPLSRDLLAYYQSRVAAAEKDMVSLQGRLEEVERHVEAAQQSRRDLLRRTDEVAELQRALSDSHVFVWEARDTAARLQAENDGLRIQEAEDRRKIQHLLALVEPLSSDAALLVRAPLPPKAAGGTPTRGAGGGGGGGGAPRIVRVGDAPEGGGGGGGGGGAASLSSALASTAPSSEASQSSD